MHCEQSVEATLALESFSFRNHLVKFEYWPFLPRNKPSERSKAPNTFRVLHGEMRRERIPCNKWAFRPRKTMMPRSTIKSFFYLPIQKIDGSLSSISLSVSNISKRSGNGRVASRDLISPPLEEKKFRFQIAKKESFCSPTTFHTDSLLSTLSPTNGFTQSKEWFHASQNCSVKIVSVRFLLPLKPSSLSFSLPQALREYTYKSGYGNDNIFLAG